MFLKHFIKATIVGILCMYCISIQAQNDSISLNDFNAKRQKITEKGFYTLLGWSTLNLSYSAISLAGTQPKNATFHRTNIAWNAINVGIALPALIALKKEMGKTFNYQESFDAQLLNEKLYLFNSALDLAFVTGGFFYRERRFNPNVKNSPAYYSQLGSAIITQGIFLFVYDTVLYLIHNRHRKNEFELKTF